jgi:6,7-dimethyl-8-ribityllumazine synthase
MTSSDDTALPAGAIADVAQIVGHCYVGDALGPARVAVVCAKFNGAVTARLLDGALSGLKDHGVPLEAVDVAWVPGAVELPLAASRLLWSGDYDAVIALGAVIRGDTAHFDFVAGECAAGLQRVALDTGVPVVFGVLTTDTIAQAQERAGPGQSNKGYEAAVTALEMVSLLDLLPPVPVDPDGDDPADGEPATGER